MISKCCELVKLCHINRMGSDLLDSMYYSKHHGQDKICGPLLYIRRIKLDLKHKLRLYLLNNSLVLISRHDKPSPPSVGHGAILLSLKVITVVREWVL